MKLNRTELLNKLAAWIADLKKAAREDSALSISWFKETEDEPFSIIGGWDAGFSEEYSDIYCISKSNPEYAMCIKIAINDGPYAYTDFELMNMPYEEDGEVDDTCIPLEWDDDPLHAARFFLGEWERIMEEYSDREIED